jgi:hypothetical protein
MHEPIDRPKDCDESAYRAYLARVSLVNWANSTMFGSGRSMHGYLGEYAPNTHYLGQANLYLAMDQLRAQARTEIHAFQQAAESKRVDHSAIAEHIVNLLNENECECSDRQKIRSLVEDRYG